MHVCTTGLILLCTVYTTGYIATGCGTTYISTKVYITQGCSGTYMSHFNYFKTSFPVDFTIRKLQIWLHLIYFAGCIKNNAVVEKNTGFKKVNNN
jgi:hypothetical protein